MMTQGGVTLHRRPSSGSIPCWGKCGRTISSNKALCYACTLEQQARDTAASEPSTQALAETDPMTTGGYGKILGAEAMK